MQRIATKLCQRGIRSFRMDLRGCGAGAGLARLPYHSGRSDDAATAVRYIADLCPHSPVTLIGFSLGANIVLKLLGEIGSDRCGGLDSGVAACPPVDLCECSRNLSRWTNRIYDAHFVSSLWRALRLKANRSSGPSGAMRLHGIRRAPLRRRPIKLFEFDDAYTAPISGFRDAEHYYRTCSCGQFIPAIRKPTLVIAAADDPMIPLRLLDPIEWPSCAQVHIAGGGGHLGFIGCGGVDSDRRWMDWRIVEWTAGLAVE
jgi:predicted alpha/beta-fold hydrolase